LQKPSSQPTVVLRMKVNSVHENGGKGVLVSVESSLTNGLPGIVLVGFAGKSLDESRERIRSAFSGSKLSLPKKRITINISPSDVPKDGAHYDLAIALSILNEAQMIRSTKTDPIVLGELGLDGSVRPVRGILGKLLLAIDAGQTHFIIPKANLPQASLIEGINVMAVDSLKELYDNFSQSPSELFLKTVQRKITKSSSTKMSYVDFSEVVGQARAKRALEIAAAGGHNVILNGPPGVGKSMLAKALPGIMTTPSRQEIISITHLHSLTNNTIVDLIQERPFRSPHHSSSDVSVIGGGQRPRPGEVSLAHGGVLMLDELPEFRRSTIESLRQPLEDGVVTVSRARESVTYPARFMLIATKNPCPCGYYGSTKPCTCSPIELQRYQKKISGPILDRIDIHVTVDNIDHKNLLDKTTGREKSTDIKKRVESAHKAQRERLGESKLNGAMNNREVKANVNLSADVKEFLDSAASKLEISARVYMKILKLARTIADLELSTRITKAHVAEALQYRPIKDV